MEPEVLNTAELLEAWRDATRAAELAERLSTGALRAAERADANVLASEDIARLAEEAAEAATRAAESARQAASKARELAASSRDIDLAAADQAVVSTKALEGHARDLYHAAEREVRERHGMATSDPTPEAPGLDDGVALGGGAAS